MSVCQDAFISSSLNSHHHHGMSSHLNLDHFSVNWSEYALRTSLCTLSRHYAGRSLQIYRALGIPFSSLRCIDKTLISENFFALVLHRLLESVADPNDDVQGYVTEKLLTLQMNARVVSGEYSTQTQT